MVEFEHSLFKLLLLVAVLSADPPGRKYLTFFIAVSLSLAFLPPVVSIPVPWDFILGMTIPLLLWQNAHRIIVAQWNGKWKDVLFWLGSAALFALIFLGFKELKLLSAILFGLVTASMIWRAGEMERTASFVGLIGPFTLIFLLAEVEPMIETPTRYLGGVFSGLFFGIVIALLSIYLSNKVNPQARKWIALGQIYLAWGLGYLAGVSAVAASLASVIVYVIAGLYRGFWPYKRVEPNPLNTWPGFIFILAVFLFLGWQAHYPPPNLIFLEVLVGFVLSLIIAKIGQRLKLDAFPQGVSLWQIGLRCALLLFPAFLIWPRQTLQEPILLAYALGIAMIIMIMIRVTINYFFDGS